MSDQAPAPGVIAVQRDVHICCCGRVCTRELSRTGQRRRTPEASVFTVAVGELGLEGCGAPAIVLIDLTGAGRDAVVEGGLPWLTIWPGS
jgi:hypothetical protein